MKRVTYAAVVAIGLGSFAGLGCEKDTSTASNSGYSGSSSTTAPSTGPAVDVDVNVNKDKMRSAADRTGDALHNAADKTGDALATAGEKTKEAAKDVGGKLNDAAHRTADATGRGFENAKEAGARITATGNKGTAAAPDAEGIRDVLAQVTQAAVKKGAISDVVERFVDADRNRLGKGELKNSAELDGRIDQFRKDWKAKFNEDFNIKNEEAAFPEQSFSIAQGEIGRDAAAGTTGADSPASPAADTNRNDPGRNVARIQVAAGHNLPAMSIPMVHEAIDKWKIDVPESLTAEKLNQNLLDHLTAADMPDQWPSDVNQAYAQVSHHILMAILDKPAK